MVGEEAEEEASEGRESQRTVRAAGEGGGSQRFGPVWDRHMTAFKKRGSA